MKALKGYSSTFPTFAKQIQNEKGKMQNQSFFIFRFKFLII